MTILFFDGDCNDGVLIADANIVNKSRIHRRINDNCFWCVVVRPRKKQKQHEFY